MSSLLHSDPDDSSEVSSTSSQIRQDLESPTPEKVPLSTSSIFKKSEISRLEKKPVKIAVRFSAIGSTAAIQPSSFFVAETQTVATILNFLMKKLGLQMIHVYVSNSFQPTPDEKLEHLHRLFNTNGVLNFSYCESIAFG